MQCTAALLRLTHHAAGPLSSSDDADRLNRLLQSAAPIT